MLRRRRRFPHRLHIGAARALVITLSVFVLTGLLTGPIADLALSSVDLWPREAWIWIVLTVLGVGAAFFQFGLWLANVVLSIIVVVKGRGALRTGAALALGSAVTGSSFSLDVSGDIGPSDAVGQVVSVLTALAAVLQVVVLIVSVIAVVLLVRGITQSRRA